MIGSDSNCSWCRKPIRSCVIPSYCGEQCREAYQRYRENVERLHREEINKQKVKGNVEQSSIVPLDYQI